MTVSDLTLPQHWLCNLQNKQQIASDPISSLKLPHHSGDLIHSTKLIFLYGNQNVSKFAWWKYKKCWLEGEFCHFVLWLMMKPYYLRGGRAGMVERREGGMYTFHAYWVLAWASQHCAWLSMPSQFHWKLFQYLNIIMHRPDLSLPSSPLRFCYQVRPLN